MRGETLARIDAALRRLEAGTYGVCGDCDQPIAAERLRALPFAAGCRPCEEAREAAKPRRSAPTKAYTYHAIESKGRARPIAHPSVFSLLGNASERTRLRLTHEFAPGKARTGVANDEGLRCHLTKTFVILGGDGGSTLPPHEGRARRADWRRRSGRGMRVVPAPGPELAREPRSAWSARNAGSPHASVGLRSKSPCR